MSIIRQLIAAWFMFCGVCFVIVKTKEGVWEEFISKPRSVYILLGTFIVVMFLIERLGKQK